MTKHEELLTLAKSLGYSVIHQYGMYKIGTKSTEGEWFTSFNSAFAFLFSKMPKKEIEKLDVNKIIHFKGDQKGGILK